MRVQSISSSVRFSELCDSTKVVDEMSSGEVPGVPISTPPSNFGLTPSMIACPARSIVLAP